MAQDRGRRSGYGGYRGDDRPQDAVQPGPPGRVRLHGCSVSHLRMPLSRRGCPPVNPGAQNGAAGAAVSRYPTDWFYRCGQSLFFTNPPLAGAGDRH